LQIIFITANTIYQQTYLFTKMKKNYSILITLALLLISVMQVGAQLVPAADNNTYYYIQFRHNAGLQAVMEDMGDGNIMKAQTRTLGKDAQLWKVTAGVIQGSYVFTSKLGNKIIWDSGTSRYKTSSTGTGADIKLLYSNNATYTKSFEFQRVGSSLAFNVWGGVAIGNDIAEYTVGDAGGTVIFVRAPEISSIDNSAEHWYWLKNYRDNGKTVNTSNVGANFDVSSPSSFRKFKVVKDAVNTTYGLVYLNGSDYTYLQAGTGDSQDPAPFSTTVHTGFSPFTSTATTGTGSGSVAGIRGWRIFRPGSSAGIFHMKVVGGGYSLRYNNTGVEDANVWSFFDARDVLGEIYSEAIEIHKSAPEGTGFGQYSSETKDVLQTAITSAEVTYNNPSSSQEDLFTAYTTLNTALSSLYASANSSLTSLLSENPDNYRWYRIKNRHYTTNDIITSNTIAENGGIITQNSGTSTDNELWRFELNAGGTAVKIINKATGLAIKENGQSAQSTLVNLSTATEFVFSRREVYWAIGRINAGSHQYLHRDGSSRLVGWEATAPASHWTLQYATETPKATRTLTVASANQTIGTAVITGTENTSATTYNPISATATATDPNYFFVNWTSIISGTIVSTSNPFVYTGTEDLEIRANFATNGIAVAPMTSTVENPVYFLIQSASDGTHVFNSYTGDFRGNVMISPTTAGKIIHNKLNTATTADHALWQIANVDEVQLLKNKATGLYMTGSHSVGATGTAANAFTFEFINGSTTQYKIRTIDAISGSNPSFTASWQSNLCDRLANVGDQPNSLIAWYFIAPAFTGTSDFSNTTDWTNGTVPADDMAVAINSDATITADRAFNGLHIAAGKSLTVNAGKGLTVRNAITGDGTITLKSDATNGTATITGNVTGTATVEQHLPSAAERTWWYLASSVSGATSDVFGSNQVGNYSEATRNYSAPFAEPTALEAGRGYVVRMNAAEAATYVFENKALNSGDISLTLTRTVVEPNNEKRGFHLAGNPYASYLNWNATYNASSNLRSTIWYRTKGASAMEFHTYNAELGVSVPSSASGYIPPMQAFWVKVDTDPVSPETVSTGILNFTNAMRGHGNSSENRLKAPAAASLPMVRLALSNGAITDETVIAFHEQASVGFDRYDSEKMSNNVAGHPELYTRSNGQELVINALPLVDNREIVSLGIRPAAAGNFTIQTNELKGMDDMLVILHDYQEGTELLLKEYSSYQFSSDATATEERFAVEFRAPGVTTNLSDLAANLTVSAREDKISILGSLEVGSMIRVYNSMGQQLHAQEATGSHTELNASFHAGIYIVKAGNKTVKITLK
jgi:hypothetical protein